MEYRNESTIFLKTAGVGFTALSGWGLSALVPQEKPSKPNILFVFIDDMGYGDLSCYGNSAIQTPNIDRLAHEGIRFTQFYANSPVCSPSRVAMTTGQYPARWKIYSYLDPPSEPEAPGWPTFSILMLLLLPGN